MIRGDQFADPSAEVGWRPAVARFDDEGRLLKGQLLDRQPRGGRPQAQGRAGGQTPQAGRFAGRADESTQILDLAFNAVGPGSSGSIFGGETLVCVPEKDADRALDMLADEYDLWEDEGPA